MSHLLTSVDMLGAEIPWLKEFRAKGAVCFERLGIPTPKTEAWKYTKPNRFFVSDFRFNPQGMPQTENTAVSLPFDSYRICFENGVFNPQSSLLPAGIEVLPLIEAIMFKPEIRQQIGSLAQNEKHPFAALNAAYLNEGVYIKIDSNVEITKPIAILYHTTVEAQPAQYQLRNIIDIQDNSSVTIVEAYSYTGMPKSVYFVNVVNEIFVRAGAVCRHIKLQNEAFKAAHIALNAVQVAQNGRYKSFCLQKGADLARNETKVMLTEAGAEAEVDAAYLMNGWATLDTTTDIEHLQPSTKSSQLVKGVIGGQAKGVFQGKIHIAPNAVKTEGYQLHKAMLLSDDAEIDVKPELEIFADDVKCSHGAACGQLDAEQLFYMRSRGIGEQEARQMLIDAYLNDVMAKVDDEKIADWIKLSLKSGQEA